ncbi:MAG TPA: hypothetical protein VK872_08250, partial [Draconibacterium sp.]|nr:hypothetical protein [Draconibacterium sp.]
MKNLVFLATLFLLPLSTFSVKCNTEKVYAPFVNLTPVSLSDVKISGYTGEKIDLCISERIKKQDIEHLIEPFRLKNETWAWQSEFWG